jgi:DNA-binding response OmpR family regulator
MGWDEVMTGSPEAGYVDRHRVLVVDDNEDLAISSSWLLEHAGHEVRVAFNGKDALEAARDFQPDVALLDLGLPDLNGLEVARRLRSEFGQSVLLIIITAYAHDDRLWGDEAPYDHYFVKPLDFAVIADLLGGATN